MLTLIKGFVEFVSALLVLISVKIQLVSWLAGTFGVAVLIVAVYFASKKKIRAVIQAGTGAILLLTVFQVTTPGYISIPVGFLMFVISISTILPTLVE